MTFNILTANSRNLGNEILLIKSIDKLAIMLLIYCNFSFSKKLTYNIDYILTYALVDCNVRIDQIFSSKCIKKAL